MVTVQALREFLKVVSAPWTPKQIEEDKYSVTLFFATIRYELRQCKNIKPPSTQKILALIDELEVELKKNLRSDQPERSSKSQK